MNTELNKKVIDLKFSDKRKRILVINDIIPAFIFFLSGMELFENDGNIPLAITNFILGLLLVIAGFKELHAITRKSGSKINWLDLVSGIAMMFNAYNAYNPLKVFQPSFFYALISIFLILQGLSIIKLKNSWKLKISDEGFKIRTGVFSKSGFRWDEIKSISRDNKKITVSTGRGNLKISLNKIENRDEVFESISTFFNSTKVK